MAGFLRDDTGPEASGVLTSGQTEDGHAINDSSRGACGDDARADVLARAGTKEFAESGEFLRKERSDGFDGHVVGRHSGSAGGDDTVHVVAPDERVNATLNPVVVVRDEFAGDDLVVRFERRLDGVAAEVLIERARGGYRDDCDTDGSEIVFVGVNRLVVLLAAVVVACVFVTVVFVRVRVRIGHVLLVVAGDKTPHCFYPRRPSHQSVAASDTETGREKTDDAVHDPEAFDEGRPQNEYDEAAARADSEFDWRGWVLVGVIIVSFLVVPGIILALPYADGTLAALGLTWRDTFLVLPLAPAVILALTAVWATARA